MIVQFKTILSVQTYLCISVSKYNASKKNDTVAHFPNLNLIEHTIYKKIYKVLYFIVQFCCNVFLVNFVFFCCLTKINLISFQ